MAHVLFWLGEAFTRLANANLRTPPATLLCSGVINKLRKEPSALCYLFVYVSPLVNYINMLLKLCRASVSQMQLAISIAAKC